MALSAIGNLVLPGQTLKTKQNLLVIHDTLDQFCAEIGDLINFLSNIQCSIPNLDKAKHWVKQMNYEKLYQWFGHHTEHIQRELQRKAKQNVLTKFKRLSDNLDCQYTAITQTMAEVESQQVENSHDRHNKLNKFIRNLDRNPLNQFIRKAYFAVRALRDEVLKDANNEAAQNEIYHQFEDDLAEIGNRVANSELL